MKEPGNSAQLLDLPFAPEADAYLDELERSGQFRIGAEAELDEQEGEPAGREYALARGIGSVFVQDWWTSGAVVLRVAAGIAAEDLVIARVDDSLVLRTRDGLDRVTLDGYAGLMPDASTLRVVFADGEEWSGPGLLSRIGSWLRQAPTAPPNH
jgi:hypothetical protein